jgi:quinol monooxygenase YgiN
MKYHNYSISSFNVEESVMGKKVVIESTIKAGVLDSLLTFLEVNLPSVRGFKGCLKVSVYLDKESGDMIFDEEWLSVEDHQKYISAIANNGVMDELVSYLESPPVIKYLDAMEI